MERSSQKEDLLLKLINHSSTISGMKDLDGKYLFANSEFEHLYNPTKKNIITLSDYDIFPASVADLIRQSDLYVISKNEELIIEKSFSLNKIDRTYLATVFPITDEQQSVIATGFIAKDITERKLAISQKEKTNQLLKAIGHAQNEYISGEDAATIFSNLLHSVLDITGSEYGFIGEIIRPPKAPPFLQTRAITDITRNKDSKELYDKLISTGVDFENIDTLSGITTLSTGLPHEEPPLSPYTGIPFYHGKKMLGILGLANRRADDNEQLIEYLEPFLVTCAYLLTAVQNRSLKKEAQDALKDSELRYRTLFETSLDAVIIISISTNRVTNANNAAKNLFGYKEIKDIIGLSLADIVPNTINNIDSLALINELRIELDKNDHVRTQWEHRRYDKSTFPCEIALTKFSVNGESFILSVIQDTTERHKSILEKEALQKQIHQSQKMEAVGQLTGGIAHDFNNILAAIQGFGELSLFSLKKSKEQKKVQSYLTEVLSATHRAKELVEQMLAFSKGEMTELQILYPEKSITSVTKMLRSTIPSTIRIEAYIDNPKCKIKADPIQLHQAIMNLIINARDAMNNNKGFISVSLSHYVSDTETCTSCHKPISQTANNKYIAISVSDNGSGIASKEIISRIFDPFFSTKDIGKGTGMGLSVVHGTVHGCNGHIIVESEIKKGTHIKMLFPEVFD